MTSSTGCTKNPGYVRVAQDAPLAAQAALKIQAGYVRVAQAA